MTGIERLNGYRYQPLQSGARAESPGFPRAAESFAARAENTDGERLACLGRLLQPPPSAGSARTAFSPLERPWRDNRNLLSYIGTRWDALVIAAVGAMRVVAVLIVYRDRLLDSGELTGQSANAGLRCSRLPALLRPLRSLRRTNRGSCPGRPRSRRAHGRGPRALLTARRGQDAGPPAPREWCQAVRPGSPRRPAPARCGCS
jgi:hypothetical protein